MIESTEGRLEGSTTRHAPGRGGGKGGEREGEGGREDGWEARGRVGEGGKG